MVEGYGLSWLTAKQLSFPVGIQTASYFAEVGENESFHFHCLKSKCVVSKINVCITGVRVELISIFVFDFLINNILFSNIPKKAQFQRREFYIWLKQYFL